MPKKSISSIQLIYAGGTFGSYGSPLAPLDAKKFLPSLQTQLKQYGHNIEFIDNSLIKDSSQLSIEDFFFFYELILHHYHKNKKRFILITGTDTLSYLGAFLSEAFSGLDIVIVLTASMKPLFNANIADNLVIDSDSDAWHNLTLSIEIVNKRSSGVFTCLQNKAWDAYSVKKIHSHQQNAFIGHESSLNPNSSLTVDSWKLDFKPCYESTANLKDSSSITDSWPNERLNQITAMRKRLANIHIYSLYIMPNNDGHLYEQLQSILDRHKQPINVIIMAFGAGNFPYQDRLAKLFDNAHKLGHMIICTTQCPFGGVSDTYAAGSWQYQHNVLSGYDLNVEIIYARLLWISLFYETPNERLKAWTLNQNSSKYNRENLNNDTHKNT